MMTRSQRLRGSAVVLLCFGLLACTGEVAAQTRSETGTLSVVWGDPQNPADSAIQIVSLAARGGAVELDIDPQLLRELGGAARLQGLEVRVEGVPQPGPAASGRIGTPRMRVGSLQIVEPAGLDPQGLSSFGDTSRPFITILCAFADSPDNRIHPVSHFRSLMGSTYPGADHYWREVSEGRIDLAGSAVTEWYVLPRPQREYLAGNRALTDQLAADCTAAADADVDFSQYWGINLQFNDRLGCCSYGGMMGLELDGIERAWPMTWEASWAAVNLGVYLHEMGHSFGLPHSGGPYGAAYDSRWDVMSDAGWVQASPFRLGTHLNGYHKAQLGWYDAEEVWDAPAGTSEVWIDRSALPAGEATARLVRIPVPGADIEDRHFTLEVREQVGYDAPLFAEGVVIHEFQRGRLRPSQVVDTDGNGSPSDEGSLWRPGETFYDPAADVTVDVLERSGAAYRVRIRNGRIAFAFDSDRVASEVGASELQAAGGFAQSIELEAVDVAGLPVSWRARALDPSIVLTNTSGTGSGRLEWEWPAEGLRPGMHRSTIEATTEDGTQTTRVEVELDVLSDGTATIGAFPTRIRSILASEDLERGRGQPIAITPSGPGASAVPWTATVRDAESVLARLDSFGDAIDEGRTLEGVGPDTLYYRARSWSLPEGEREVRVEIVAPGFTPDTAVVLDQMLILGQVVPGATLTPTGPTRVEVPQGSEETRNSIRLDLTDDLADAPWIARAFSWIDPELKYLRFVEDWEFRGSGSAELVYQRNVEDRLPGVYIDTLFVGVGLGDRTQLMLVDTLEVTASGLGLALNPEVRVDTVVFGQSAARDSARISFWGPGASSIQWNALWDEDRFSLVRDLSLSEPGSGTGSSWLRWHRVTTLGQTSSEPRPPGTYVDSIVVLTGLGTMRLLDSLVVVPGFDFENTSEADSDTTWVGNTAALLDSASVPLSGFRAETAEWSLLSSTGDYLTALRDRGTPAASLIWSRDASRLPIGEYAGSLVVTAAGVGGRTWTLEDRLVVQDSARLVAPPLGSPLTIEMVVDDPRPDSARLPVVVTGYRAETVSWAASAEASWLTLTSLEGIGGDSIRGVLDVDGLEAGLYSGAIRVEPQNAAGLPISPDAVTVPIELVIVAPPEPERVVRALLDDETLISAAETGWLDRTGNDDGELNLGDVLAWLDRSGTPVSPAMLRQLEAAVADSANVGRGPGRGENDGPGGGEEGADEGRVNR